MEPIDEEAESQRERNRRCKNRKLAAGLAPVSGWATRADVLWLRREARTRNVPLRVLVGQAVAQFVLGAATPYTATEEKTAQPRPVAPAVLTPTHPAPSQRAPMNLRDTHPR